jgi:hypothetical protein
VAATKYFEVEIEVKVIPVNGSPSPKKCNSLKEDKGKTITFKRRFHR